jgi:hypothetical protein
MASRSNHNQRITAPALDFLMSTNVSRLQVSGHEATHTQCLKICSRMDTTHFASGASKLGQILGSFAGGYFRRELPTSEVALGGS